MEALMEGTKQKMSTKPAGVRSRRPRAASAYHALSRGGGAARQPWSRRLIPATISRGSGDGGSCGGDGGDWGGDGGDWGGCGDWGGDGGDWGGDGSPGQEQPAQSQP